MKVCAHYASLCDSLLCEITCMLWLGLCSVLISEVRDHEVSMIYSEIISLICLLQSTVGIVICELAEVAERLVVLRVTTCSHNVVCSIVEHHLLRIVDTLGRSNVCEVIHIHACKSGKGIIIISIEVIIADNTLLRYVEHGLTRCYRKEGTC